MFRISGSGAGGQKAAIIGAGVRGLKRRELPFLAAAATVLGLDQLTKAVVSRTMEVGQYFPSDDWPLRLHYVTNTGAAFGILQDQTAFLIVTSIIGIAAIVYYWLSQRQPWPTALALGMMLGGAAGNLLDRVRLGHVVDFLSFPHYPSFNVADSSIVVAFVVLIGYHLLWEEKERQKVPEGVGREDPGADG